MLSRVIISKAALAHEERGSWVFNAEQWLKKQPPVSLDYIMLMMIWQQIFYQILARSLASCRSLT
jgi:hypothetical protein